MKRLLGILALAGLCLWLFGFAGGLSGDLEELENGLLRLHVVGASDEAEDQEVKLLVRDAVTGLLQEAMEQCPDLESAEAYVQAQLPRIRETALETLRKAGCTLDAAVSLEEEIFPTRIYDTFRLPSGVYKTLRITIGSGQGHNWWCVLFPSLCIPASSEGFEEAAEASGLSEDLTHTLTAEDGAYEIRFRCLDFLGQLQTLLHS